MHRSTAMLHDACDLRGKPDGAGRRGWRLMMPRARDAVYGIVVPGAALALAAAIAGCSGGAAGPSPAVADPCHQAGITYCALNPNVTQATIHQTVCVSGWTATIRPPESYTENLKTRQIAQEGLSGTLSNYEEDHRMPLELGGAPSDADNLSPESPPSPNPKDSDESRIRRAVCAGQMTLVQAQQQLVQTWLAAYPGYRQ